MHFTHIRLKPTQKFQKDFDFSDATKDIEVPREGKELNRNYAKSEKLADDFGYDILLEFDNSIIYGFDFLHNGDKFIIPELNPTSIFYSNAIMSHRNLITSKERLVQESPTLKNFKKPIDEKIFGTFFQYAANCIINLQSTIESFANRQIPTDHIFLDRNGKEFEPSVFHKIDKVLPDLKGKKFKKEFRKDNNTIRRLIELRNEIIHLKPIKETTNTQYKILYRKIINFEFTEAVLAVKNLVNFYEPNLIEECSCGKEYYYDISFKDK